MLNLPEVVFLRAWAATTLKPALNEARQDERGVSDLLVLVIVGAIVAAGAIAIATLIITKFTAKADTIPTG